MRSGMLPKLIVVVLVLVAAGPPGRLAPGAVDHLALLLEKSSNRFLWFALLLPGLCLALFLHSIAPSTMVMPDCGIGKFTSLRVHWL